MLFNYKLIPQGFNGVTTILIQEMMMKKLTQVFIIAMLLMTGSNRIVAAQGESLQLSVIRTWGYAGFKNDIQGRFSFTVSGPENLQSVQYLLDDKVVMEVSEPPFKFKLNTDDYENGVHTIKAVAILSDGTQISSINYTRQFVPPITSRLFTGLWLILIIPIIIIAIIDLVLKAIGMWKAARRTQKAWFVCLLLFNTMCILPVIYFLTGGKKPETLKI
jgi:hypothetical protein